MIHPLILANAKGMAEYLLREFEEFFPFGGYLNAKDDHIPLFPIMEEEFPKSEEVIQVLENGIREKMSQADFQCAYICTDVLMRPAPHAEAKDALRITIYTSGEVYDSFVHYHKAEPFSWSEPFIA